MVTYLLYRVTTVVRPLPFLLLKVQRLVSYVTVVLIQCVLISSLLSPCQHRCSDGRLGSFLICDICRSRPLGCSRGAQARGLPFGIWGRYRLLCRMTNPLIISLMWYMFSASYIFNCCAVSESSGLSFQLASLDESGVLNFWVSWITKSYIYSTYFLPHQTFQTWGMPVRGRDVRWKGHMPAI